MFKVKKLKKLCKYVTKTCLRCFDTVGWASRRASGLQKLSDEVLVSLSVWCETVWRCRLFAHGPADAGWGDSVTELLANWTQAQRGLGSNRSRDAAG